MHMENREDIEWELNWAGLGVKTKLNCVLTFLKLLHWHTLEDHIGPWSNNGAYVACPGLWKPNPVFLVWKAEVALGPVTQHIFRLSEVDILSLLKVTFVIWAPSQWSAQIWLFNYQQRQAQLLLQLVKIFPYCTIGTAENLYFSFYFGIHSVSCNDQHKIFQITEEPLTAGEEHLYTSREPRPSCAKIKSLFDWDFKPFLDKRRGNYSLAPLFSV